VNDTAKRGLGFWMTLALVVGNLIGSGIYLLPATLAPLGANQLAGWVITIAGSLCMATALPGYPRQPLAGGPLPMSCSNSGRVRACRSLGLLDDGVDRQWRAGGGGGVQPQPAATLAGPYAGRAGGTGVGVVWLLTLVNIRGCAARVTCNW
jgi:APA family basic amino acid/polyamine antiporter